MSTHVHAILNMLHGEKNSESIKRNIGGRKKGFDDMESDKTQELSIIEIVIMKEIEELMPGFLNRNYDALLGRVIRELLEVVPGKEFQMTNYASGLAAVLFDYHFFHGNSILEAGLRALKKYLEKKNEQEIDKGERPG